MRHLLSLLFGLFLAPVIWFLAALGQYRITQALGDEGVSRATVVEVLLGALLMAAGGLWLGLLLSVRLSPVGPGIAGVLWMVLGLTFTLDIDAVLNLIPNGPTGQVGLYELPLRHGYVFLVATALLVPLFSPARWRVKAADDAVDEPRYMPFGPVPEPVGSSRHDAQNMQRGAVEQPPRNPGGVAEMPGRRVDGSTGAQPRRRVDGSIASPTGEVSRPDAFGRVWGDAPDQANRTPWDR